MGKWKEVSFREAVAIEYLAGGIDQRSLGAKYHVPKGSVYRWVKAYREKINPQLKSQVSKTSDKPIAVIIQSPVDKKVKQLEFELRQSKLHNELLQAMIDIAEQDLGVSIRKKSGTKRS
jgi:transposase